MGTRLRTHTSSKSPGAGRRTPGLYMGIVTDNDDPRKIGRVRVRVPEVGGQKILAWAKPPMAVGGDKTGVFTPLAVEAQVLVTFEANDTNRPVILGAWYPQVSEKSTLPTAALGDDDSVRDARGQDLGTGGGGVELEEPEDPYGAKYPFNFVFKSPGSGHLIEVDDTAGKERISITHGPSKSWFEFHPDGTIVMGAQAKRYIVVEAANQEHFKTEHDVYVEGAMSHRTDGTQTEEYGDDADVTYEADHDLTVQGDQTKTIQGDQTKTIQGSQTETVQGDKTQTITGKTNQTSTGDVTQNLAAKYTAMVGAAVMITLGAAMTLMGTSRALTLSTMSVTAGAITLGSSGGGLALMNEVALVLLNVNIGLYNAHIHTAPNGASPPTTPMVPLPNAPSVDKTQITKAL